MATPACQQLEDVVTAHFPGTRFGRVNCRRIAGSTRYSQHSWNNARDIYAPLEHPDPSAWIDEIKQFLEANFEELNIRLILWQVKSHFGHMHVDVWPTGIGTPPCDGGTERYRNYDGTVIYGAPPLNNIWEEEDMAFEKTWATLVELGLIEGDPTYYSEGRASEEEVDNAVSVAIRELNNRVTLAHDRLDDVATVLSE